MTIDHIAIWTNDLEKVKEFYLKYFNCTANEKYENKKKQFSSYFLSFSGGARIELMKSDSVSETKQAETTGLAHLAINIGTKEKVDSLTKQIEEAGYTIYSHPRTTGDGCYESVIADPVNNRIELTAV